MPRTTEMDWKFKDIVTVVAERKLGRGYQSRLAEAMGIAPGAVSQHLSRGAGPMSEATVYRFATALEIPYLQLLSSGIALLTTAAENDDEDEDEEVQPRSSVERAPAAAKVGKPHRRSGKTGKVKPAQPPHATKQEVEAAPVATAKKTAKKKSRTG